MYRWGILANLEFCLVGDCFLLFFTMTKSFVSPFGRILGTHFPSIFKQMVSKSVDSNAICFFRGWDLSLIYDLPTWCFINMNHWTTYTIYGKFIGISISWLIPIYPPCSKNSNVLMVPRWNGNVFHRLGCVFWVILLRLVPSFFQPPFFTTFLGRYVCGTFSERFFFYSKSKSMSEKFDFASM